jgi:TPP-dependent 2-oxoacid decarboxylase
MTELSREQLDEIVARVTAAVLDEVRRAEAGTAAAGEMRIPMRNAATLADEVLWAPWTVALPAELGAATPGAEQQRPGQPS